MRLDLLATARALATDAVCAEVVAAWQAEGIEPVLLKGPTIAEWLYPGEVRGYVDADLLVDPRRVMDAAAVLTRLGFAPVDHHVSLHAHPWIRRADSSEIDLHVTFWGPRRSPERVWAELQGWLEPRRVGAVTLNVLSTPARALQVALHAAQHTEVRQPREDLIRALERTPDELWRQAAELADRLWALNAMADGLRLTDSGRELLQRLPLVHAAAIAEQADAPFAIGLARFSIADSPRARLAVLAAAILPSREELIAKEAAAPEHGIALLVLYVRHVLHLVAGIPRTVRAMRRARRVSG